MVLLPIERMLLSELLAAKQAAIAPIDAKLNAAVGEIGARLGIPPEACRIDLASGQVVDVRPVAMAFNGVEAEPVAELVPVDA